MLLALRKLANLRALRERCLMTQEELASKAGVSPTTIVQIEAGRVEPRFATIKKLAKALGVKPGELLGPVT